MIELTSILSNFKPITLEQMDHVKLLNRMDTKFVIDEEKLPVFLTSIASQYSLLTIDNKTIHPYETLYFDTPGLNLYHMHRTGRSNRYKLRFRKYTDSGISFFEIKRKTNTSRTVKNRMQVPDIPENIDDSLNGFLKKHTPEIYNCYQPALRVFFDRLTFVNLQANERLTFDLNLRYSCGEFEKKIEKIVIAEIKQEKHSQSPFIEKMKQVRLHKNYISKYCMGIICTHKELKMNNFKHKINTLKKLGYDI